MGKERGMCSKCGTNPQAIDRKRGRTYFRKKCASCTWKESKKGYDKNYTRQKHCEACGTVPRVDGILQIDHISGNRKDNDPRNYWTLCLTCHQIKSNIEAKNRQIIDLSNKLVDLERRFEEIGGKLDD